MSFKNFIKEMNNRMGISLPEDWEGLSEIDLTQKFLKKLNEYFYQTYEGIGTTTFEGTELTYFSEFHKFWEANNKEILNAKIEQEQTMLAAQSLNNAISQYSTEILTVTHETHGIDNQAIAQVRFFTANQDFRAPLEDQFGKYLEDPDQFDTDVIYEEPDDFLKFLGITTLSQIEKRRPFAKKAAEFLRGHGGTAYDIAQRFDNDAYQIREAIISTPGMGYGLKKANMFIRDMVELDVWQTLTNYDVIDVASDRNTMKLALRTRILQTDIPLLSSFLDIFCHQYEYIDAMSAKAWRSVWEAWHDNYPDTAPSAPCKMDFLLYRIGREYCKENKVVEYECGNGHSFFHFGSGKKICPICRRANHNVPVHRKDSFLPCQINNEDLPRKSGRLALKDKELLKKFKGVCIFEDTCQPRSETFHALNPPKSISIIGRTAWTESYAYRDKGGGGMMG